MRKRSLTPRRRTDKSCQSLAQRNGGIQGRGNATTRLDDGHGCQVSDGAIGRG